MTKDYEDCLMQWFSFFIGGLVLFVVIMSIHDFGIRALLYWIGIPSMLFVPPYICYLVKKYARK